MLLKFTEMQFKMTSLAFLSEHSNSDSIQNLELTIKTIICLKIKKNIRYIFLKIYSYEISCIFNVINFSVEAIDTSTDFLTGHCSRFLASSKACLSMNFLNLNHLFNSVKLLMFLKTLSIHDFLLHSANTCSSLSLLHPKLY